MSFRKPNCSTNSVSILTSSSSIAITSSSSSLSSSATSLLHSFTSCLFLTVRKSSSSSIFTPNRSVDAFLSAPPSSLESESDLCFSVRLRLLLFLVRDNTSISSSDEASFFSPASVSSSPDEDDSDSLSSEAESPSLIGFVIFCDSFRRLISFCRKRILGAIAKPNEL